MGHVLAYPVVLLVGVILGCYYKDRIAGWFDVMGL